MSDLYIDPRYDTESQMISVPCRSSADLDGVNLHVRADPPHIAPVASLCIDGAGMHVRIPVSAVRAALAAAGWPVA